MPRDEPVPPHLLEEALALLHEALGRDELSRTAELLLALEGLGIVLPQLRAQDWREHGAQTVQR